MTPKAFLWHLSGHRWEKAMEKVDDAPPKSIASAHKKFLGPAGDRVDLKRKKKYNKSEEK